MVGGFVDLAADGVVVVELEFTFETRNFKRRHVVVEVEDDEARWVTVVVDGYSIYFVTFGKIYLQIEQDRKSKSAALYTTMLDGVE